MLIVLVLLTGGCEVGKNEQLEFFENKVSKVLADTDSVVVQLNELTNFEWKKVCFENNKYIPFENIKYTQLTFFSKKGEVVFELPREEYVLPEHYNPVSPSGKCFHSNDQIMIKKYSGKKNLFEFSMIDKRT